MNERELVYLYRTENSRECFDVLFNKYYRILLRMTTRAIRTTFPNVPLDYEDTKSIAYLSLMEGLKQFDFNQFRYSVGQALLTMGRSKISHYCGSFTTTAHMISNVALDQELGNIENCVKHSVNGEKEAQEKLCKEEQLDLLNAFATKQNVVIKRIIFLKSQGYSDFEIGKIVRMKSKNVSNAFSTFAKNFRKKYINKYRDLFYREVNCE